ncbi:MAG: hypothetical protein Q9217_004277 [Psora testacea]
MSTLEEEQMHTALEDSLRNPSQPWPVPPAPKAQNRHECKLFSLSDNEHSHGESTPRGPGKPAGHPPRYNIDDCIRDITERQALDFPGISDQDGDTLIFIDPPSRQPQQSDVEYEHYLRHYREPIIMKSSKLKAASEVFKARLEDPTGQYRTIRHRGLVNKLSGNHKFVLDLTPPDEGEEAVYLTATLSCTEGVRLWYLAGDIWHVSDRMARGGGGYSSPALARKDICGPSAPGEYSPILHRSAIERVLAAIQGHDLKFDTAVKVWTTSMVAQFFNVRDNLLIDSIVTWLQTEPNHYFYEVNTEITLRIAAGFEIQDMLRDAFAILVGEEALDAQIRARTLAIGRPKSSTFGRRKDELPEALQERVEYASKSFVDRNIKDFEHLIDDDMQWLDGLPTVQNLSAFKNSGLWQIAASLKRNLKKYVRGAVCRVLCSDYYKVPGPFLPGLKGQALIPRRDRTETWSTLQPRERLFTRTFWEALKSQNLLRNKTNLDFIVCPFKRPAMRALSPFGRHPEISTSRLRDQIRQGQVIFDDARASGIKICSSRAYVDDYDVSSKAQVPGVTAPFTQEMLKMKVSHPDDERSAITALQEAKAVLTADIYASRRKQFLRDCLAGMDDEGRSHAPLTDRTRAPSKDGYNALANISARPEPTTVIKNEFVWKDTSSTDQQVPTAPSPTLHGTDAEKVIPTLAQTGYPVFFDLDRFCSEASRYLTEAANRKLAPSDSHLRQYPYVPNIINTLTSLEDSEWKYLPLWAGGLDDGTGAVYTDDIMETAPDAGFAPGHGIHTEGSAYSDTSSEFDMASDCPRTEGEPLSSSSSSFHTSTVVNDGYSDQIHRHRTYAASSVPGSEESMVDLAAEDEELYARLQVEALERLQAAEAEAAAATKRRKHASKSEDVDFSDIFDGKNGELDFELEDDDSDATETGDDFEDLAVDTCDWE